MAAMLSGLILVAAFGVLAVAGLLLVVALYRISGRPAVGAASDAGQHSDLSRIGPKGS